MRVHIAGCKVNLGKRYRQLCVWCGHQLCNSDSADRVVREGRKPGSPFWENGAFVAVDGDSRWIVPNKKGTQLPQESCVEDAPN